MEVGVMGVIVSKAVDRGVVVDIEHWRCAEGLAMSMLVSQLMSSALRFVAEEGLLLEENILEEVEVCNIKDVARSERKVDISERGSECK